MNFVDIYNSGEIIVPDGSPCEHRIVLIYKQLNGVVANAIGMLRQDTETQKYSVYGIMSVDPKTNRVLESSNENESFSLGANLRKVKFDDSGENLQLLQRYNALYGEIFDFVFFEEVTPEQRNMVFEFIDLREDLLYTAELELCKKISPEFYDWVDRISV